VNTASLDPAVTQAISLLSGALAMAIISIVSYYFPKGHDRFDRDDRDDRRSREKEEDFDEER
jgi:hypothetical protein